MIRSAHITDAKAIHQLLLGYAQQGQLLGRSLVDIYDALRDFHVFQEQDEMNNLFYPSLFPIYFEYGMEYKSSEEKEVFKFENDVPFSKENIKRSKFNTVVNDDFKNAYTSEEILAFFKKEKRNGNIDKKIQAYKDGKSTNMRPKN